MPVTPADVRQVAFSKPPLGMAGYHEDEVDAFLDLVEAALARLIQDNTELRAQVPQLDQRPRAMPTTTAGSGPPRLAGPVLTPPRPPVTHQTRLDVNHDVRAAHTLVVAQEKADQVTEQAHTTAGQVLNQARTDCEQLIATAQDQAEDLIKTARTRAKTILQNARSTAQTVQRQSEDKAASLEQDATRKRTVILNTLNQDKGLLENTIDELRAFELEYRTQLATYLHSLIHKLDGPGSAAPINPIYTQQGRVGSGLETRSQTGPPVSPSA
jgi:DivIVA domain-containing protein